jgi:dihydroorotase
MKKHYDLIIKNGLVYSQGSFHNTDVAVSKGMIEALGNFQSDTADKIINAKGLHVLPGVIDTQVHFREPGNEHKEDLQSGTLSAISGGVTAVFEMPNTKPPTTTLEALKDKMNRAKERTYCDYAFYIGASHENISELSKLEFQQGVCGTKIFMGSSTGSLLVEDDFTLEKILKAGKRRVAVHSEDEYRLKDRKHIAIEAKNPIAHPEWRDEETALNATRRILDLAKKTFRPVHVLHVTSAREIELLGKNKDISTVEVTPQHLTLFAPDCYEKLGTLAQMNPPIRDKHHMDALWRGIANGTVDVIGTDHAPHTLEEKKKEYPDSPSGMPGVQTLIPIMLNHVNNGKLSLERLVELLCVNPAKIFQIRDRGNIAVGMEATFTLIDLKETREITHDWLKSKCNWSPYEGMEVTGWPKAAILRGKIAMFEDEIIDFPKGMPLVFSDVRDPI